MANARSGLPCIRCGSNHGVYGRHYNGFRQHSYGKGMRKKCRPFAVADFCKECDADFQEGSVPKTDWEARIEYSEEWLHWCMMSLIRRVENGVIG